MRRHTTASLAIVTIATTLAFLMPQRHAHAAVADWQQSVTIFARWDTDFSGDPFKESVRRASETGANMITLHIPLYQYDSYTTEVWTGWNTPTDQALSDGIQYIHGRGMGVMLKFQVIPYDGQWSAYIDPTDRDAWFASYQSVLMHYASLAQSLGVEEICLGTELISMTSERHNVSNTWRWQNLIAAIRGAYSGRLTYSANWGGDDFTDEKANINFWSSLDDIGIAAYVNLSGDGSVDQLKDGWHSFNMNEIQPLHERWGKPIVFTEVGYKSVRDSYRHPWMYWEGGDADPDQQARDYEALLQYGNDYPYMQGAHWWHWSSDPNAGGAGDTEYTPQNKPAEDVLKRWFAGGGQPPAPEGTPAFFAEADASNSFPQMGQEIGFSFDFLNEGDPVSDTIIDAEIYDTSGARVFQQFFEHQAFGSPAFANYTIRWTPQAAGAYALKLGAFSGGWRHNYYWLDEAARVSVGGQAVMNIWWPSDGASVSGAQPFKALLRDIPVDDYVMYWQTEGGLLNVMPTNHADYPHKETLVDMALWTWREDGRYPITFVAKDPAGNTISKRSVSVHVFQY